MGTRRILMKVSKVAEGVHVSGLLTFVFCWPSSGSDQSQPSAIPDLRGVIPKRLFGASQSAQIVTPRQRPPGTKFPAMSNHERFEAMFAKALILPISAVTLLAGSQFAAAQSIQPISPCPPGKIAQNNNLGTDSPQRTANITEESRKREGSQRLAEKYDSGGGNTQMKPVAGQPIDPLGCR